eukprot:867650-Pleurochrysis_carterae.AAC.1
MRMIPTKDTKQRAQIKRIHRRAGIKCRKYVSENDEYGTGIKDKLGEESKGKREGLKGNPGTER